MKCIQVKNLKDLFKNREQYSKISCSDDMNSESVLSQPSNSEKLAERAMCDHSHSCFSEKFEWKLTAWTDSSSKQTINVKPLLFKIKPGDFTESIIKHLSILDDLKGNLEQAYNTVISNSKLKDNSMSVQSISISSIKLPISRTEKENVAELNFTYLSRFKLNPSIDITIKDGTELTGCIELRLRGHLSCNQDLIYDQDIAISIDLKKVEETITKKADKKCKDYFVERIVNQRAVGIVVNRIDKKQYQIIEILYEHKLYFECQDAVLRKSSYDLSTESSVNSNEEIIAGKPKIEAQTSTVRRTDETWDKLTYAVKSMNFNPNNYNLLVNNLTPNIQIEDQASISLSDLINAYGETSIFGVNLHLFKEDSQFGNLQLSKNVFYPTLSVMDLSFDLSEHQLYYTELIAKLKECNMFGSNINDYSGKQHKTYYCGLMKGRLTLEFVVMSDTSMVVSMKALFIENQPLHFRIPLGNQLSLICDFLRLNTKSSPQPTSDSYYSILWSSKSGKLSTLMFHQFLLRTQKAKAIYNNSYHKLMQSKYNNCAGATNITQDSTFPDFLGMIPIKFPEEMFKTKMSLMLSIPFILSQDFANLVASIDPRVFTSYDIETKSKAKNEFNNNSYR